MSEPVGLHWQAQKTCRTDVRSVAGKQITPYLLHFPIMVIRWVWLLVVAATEHFISEAHNRCTSHVWHHSQCGRTRTMEARSCAASLRPRPDWTIPACPTLLHTSSSFSVDGWLGSICKHGSWHSTDVCNAGGNQCALHVLQEAM